MSLHNLAIRVALVFSLALCLFGANPQEKTVASGNGSACSDRKKAVASIPPNVLAGISVAFGKRDFEEALRIARKPRSGVKVTYLCRDARGRIVALTIASRDGCTVAMMQMNTEARPARAGAQQPATASIQLGQTIDQVIAVLGQPEKAVDLGSKKIYVYKDLRITSVNGKVSDVQ